MCTSDYVSLSTLTHSQDLGSKCSGGGAQAVCPSGCSRQPFQCTDSHLGEAQDDINMWMSFSRWAEDELSHGSSGWAWLAQVARPDVGSVVTKALGPHVPEVQCSLDPLPHLEFSPCASGKFGVSSEPLNDVELQILSFLSKMGSCKAHRWRRATALDPALNCAC